MLRDAEHLAIVLLHQRLKRMHIPGFRQVHQSDIGMLFHFAALVLSQRCRWSYTRRRAGRVFLRHFTTGLDGGHRVWFQLFATFLQTG
jgi:hypothetical protein